MSPDKFDHWLTNTLADSEDYLDDKGFTECVMAALPAEPTVSEREVTALSWMVGILAAIVAALLLPWPELVATVQSADTLLLIGISAIPALLISVASLLWGAINFRAQI